ncbi:hypothetical protein DYB37_007691 [Aphanomyces astaci]|uniref:Uncharacterized protein n=1 Tax=Aphanomyces astaci TaxID=112090 RepID=A0A418F3D2_APHAT|nr:hypothetical protein DYB37_007691 [Aphanomyces astaci]
MMAIRTRDSSTFRLSTGVRDSVYAQERPHAGKPELAHTSSYADASTTRTTATTKSGIISRSQSFPVPTKSAVEDDAKLVALVELIQKCVDTIHEIKIEVDSAAATLHRRHTAPCAS